MPSSILMTKMPTNPPASVMGGVMRVSTDVQQIAKIRGILPPIVCASDPPKICVVMYPK